MLDFMVDIETTGTRPDRAAAIQIAAWRFDLATGDIDEEPFDRCLTMMPHRAWDMATRQWWSEGPKRAVLQRIHARMEPPVEVLRDFADWVGYGHPAPPRMWAKPSHFEHPFLESHFHDAGIPNPFHYRHVQDLNTHLAAKLGTFDLASFWDSVPFPGEAHDAQWDALHQLLALLEARRRG